MNDFNRNVQVILRNAEREMFELFHPYVGTEHLLLSLLSVDNIKKICGKYGLTYDSFKGELLRVVGKSHIKSEVALYTPLMRKVLDNAVVIARNRGQEIDEKILLSSMLTSDDGIALQILDSMDVDIDGIYNDLYVVDKELVNIGVNLCDGEFTKLIGRDKEISSIIEVLLRKKKNNPILIGDAGVGKSHIVYELARRIRDGEVPKKLKDFKIVSLDMASMLSNTKYRGEFEGKLKNVINEVISSGNIILFIDEIHTIVKSGGSEASIDAANILKPYLSRDDIKVIGATTTYEYDKYIRIDKALSRRFESILIKEPNREEVINILSGVRDEYEDYYGIKITDDNILDIVNLSDKYIVNKSNPDKCLDVLDNVLAKIYVNSDEIDYLRSKDYKSALKCKLSKRTGILKKDIIDTISSMTRIRLFSRDDYRLISNLIDSNGVDSKLKDIFKLNINSDKLLSLLFKGDGKTNDFAREIARELDYNLIEVVMNEFNKETSINRFIGVDVGYVGHDDECIFDKVKFNPHSLLLIKNIDNADISIINLFKSILDKGIVKNKKEEDINFNNSLIVFTSNIVRNSIGFSNDLVKNNCITDNVIEFNNVYSK